MVSLANCVAKRVWDVVLCITLPNASRTAWLVKFSDGMRLMKCFCLLFSCSLSTPLGFSWAVYYCAPCGLCQRWRDQPLQGETRATSDAVRPELSIGFEPTTFCWASADIARHDDEASCRVGPARWQARHSSEPEALEDTRSPAMTSGGRMFRYVSATNNGVGVGSQ